jgi:dolichol-phosphate mannosyltransferase
MIIIPTYNERKNIRILVGRIRAVLPEIPILFVEDNSPDGTGSEIKDLQTQDQNIHMLARATKAGFASAYLDGFRFVLQNFNPDFVITMDADLSHPPEKLSELIEQVRMGKVAIGSRYTDGGSVANWSLKRKILSRFANLYARILTKLGIRDLTAGFIAMPTEKLKQLDLDQVHSRGYAFLMELKVHLTELKSEIIEIPITFEERKEGESKMAGSIIMEGIRYPAKIFWNRQKNENNLAWVLFFISLIVYVATLPRTIFFGDSPEFMATAGSLGIAHPPGYPLYALIGKLFTFIPLGNLEFRIGLFSALSASLALVVFYFLFLKIAKVRTIAFVTALILGFSPLFWSQAIMAKVYMPSLLVTLGIFLLFAKFWETTNSRYMVWAMFLFGLGAGFHQMILLFLPLLLFALIAYLWKTEKVFSRRYKFTPLVAGCLLFLLGLCVYLYLPLREKMHSNFYDFSRIYRLSPPLETAPGLYEYVRRTEYGDFGGKFVMHDKLIFVASFFESLWNQFYWLLLLAPIGMIGLWFKKRKFWVLTVGAFLLNSFAIIFLRSSPWNYENDVMYSYYYLPATAITVIWIGLGLYYILKLLIKKFSGQMILRLSLLTIILPLVLFTQNYKHNDLSKFTVVDEYTKDILESLEPNAVLLAHYQGANMDTVVFGFHYQQIVKKIRPDVTILTVSDIYPELDRKILGYVFQLKDPKNIRFHLLNYTLKSDIYKNRPIYTTYLVDRLDEKGNWTEISNGLVYKFFQNSEHDVYNDTYNDINIDKDLKLMENDMYGKDLLAQYYYGQAVYFAGKQDLRLAQQNFIKGIQYDYKSGGIDQVDYINYRSKALESKKI